MATVAQEIMCLARRGGGGYVCVANVHMLVEARRDDALREVMESAALVVSDGMPLVRRLRQCGFPGAEQVRGPDLMKELCRRAAEEKLPVYFYGGNDKLMEKLRASLAGSLPKLRIAGAQAAPELPPKPALDATTVEDIRNSGAQIVFAGLGCPKQEFWMRSYTPHLNAVLIGVGQAFAIAAGQLPEARPWMRRWYLEWLFRLCREPRRLGPRYLVANSLYLAYRIREILTGSKR